MFEKEGMLEWEMDINLKSGSAKKDSSHKRRSPSLCNSKTENGIQGWGDVIIWDRGVWQV